MSEPAAFAEPAGDCEMIAILRVNVFPAVVTGEDASALHFDWQFPHGP